MIKVTKRDGSKEGFNFQKIYTAVKSSFEDIGKTMPSDFADVLRKSFIEENPRDEKGRLIPLTVESIQDRIQQLLYDHGYRDVYDNYLIYRYEHKMTREYVKSQKAFIEKYIGSDNTANATVDDNSNVSSKNIGILNNEIHKNDNIKTSRGMIMDQLKKSFPDFDHKQYMRDLSNHIIYKHDESSFAGPIAPYCVATSMYPFLINGIKDLGGLSASPKNLDSFCGMYVNFIFAVASQFAGAVATPEFFVCFDYFARKKWGDDYYTVGGDVQKQIHQYFQQVVYSINQPAAARGMQAAFVNFSYFDKPFFDGMFGNFMFPDGSHTVWESVNWLQRDFMVWFNEERLRCVLTFPVESFALVYKDGKFLDEDAASFVAEEYARGHSFFTYISDTVDSLSSCCFRGDEIVKMYDDKGSSFCTKLSDFVNYNDPEIKKEGSTKLKGNYYIDSYNLSGEKEKTKITGILKKQYTGAMFTFELDDQSITVTADHELMVKDLEGKIISIKAEDLAKDINDYQLVTV